MSSCRPRFYRWGFFVGEREKERKREESFLSRGAQSRLCEIAFCVHGFRIVNNWWVNVAWNDFFLSFFFFFLI